MTFGHLCLTHEYMPPAHAGYSWGADGECSGASYNVSPGAQGPCFNPRFAGVLGGAMRITDVYCAPMLSYTCVGMGVRIGDCIYSLQMSRPCPSGPELGH